MNKTHGLSWRQAGDPAVLLACGLGSGFLPRAPGTWGSLLALLLWWMFFIDDGLVVQIAVIIATFIVGTLLVARVQRVHPVTDDGALVIDEVVGQWIVLLGIGSGASGAFDTHLLFPMLAGFGLFRLFDIWKPWPIRTLERRVGGALGVMLDDVLAGLMGLAVLQLTLWFIADL